MSVNIMVHSCFFNLIDFQKCKFIELHLDVSQVKIRPEGLVCRYIFAESLVQICVCSRFP